ncbi:MAG: vanadium-dependent haloperoxidase [Saprospiraceae bacterium]
MKKLFTLLIFSGILLVMGCRDSGGDFDQTQRIYKNKPSDYEARLLNEWMQLSYQAIKDNFLYGPHAARTYGYLGLTAWECIHFGIPGAKSLAGQVNGYNSPAIADPNKEYDWGIVLCTAMKQVFPEIVDNFSPAQRSQADALAILQEGEMMAKGLSQEVRNNSVDLGNAVAQRIIERIRRDGRDVIRNIVPVLPPRTDATKWYWDPGTLGQSPVEPMWGTLMTFVVRNSQACEIAAPYPYSEAPSSDFYREALEVYNVERNNQNRAIAYHWDNGPGRTCSPACHWVNIALQMIERENLDLARAAKLFAQMGVTVSDAFSVSWYLKYKYNLLRPITYIRETMDPNWTPMIGTPPYPDYTSGSSTVGAAAATIMRSTFGDVAFVDRSHLGSPLYTPDGGPFILPERSFTSFTQAADEQALSRILGGVHFRRACDLGTQSGRCVGNTVAATLDFGF